MEQIISRNPNQTIGLGERFAARVGGGEVFALYGELGSGKTTFTQGLAKGLGIKKRILSPTFIIVRHYTINRNKTKFLYHIDLYRVETQTEIHDLGLKDLLNKSSNIIVVEWPERLAKFLPNKRTDIYFKYISDNEREIKWIKY